MCAQKGACPFAGSGSRPDRSLNILGVPTTRVHPLFRLIVEFPGWNPGDTQAILLWVAAVLISGPLAGVIFDFCTAS